MTVTVVFEFLRWLVIIALAGFLCWMTYRLLVLFLKEMDAPPPFPGDPHEKPGIWIESNWGGLGGGLSGWRVSNAATYLLLICLLLGCLVVATFSLVKPQEQGSQKQEQSQQKKAETAEQKGSAGQKADQEKAGVATDEKGAEKKNEAQSSDQKSGGSGGTDAEHSEKTQQKSSSDKKDQH
jgi:hypothetical protein